ncbi:uncharacterized protein LOC116307550 isoform X2 [Actinia tenebrosa]|uniref:Uncharacterized protein LOC116307550 isoform X2 n=1 Tax=Actinia tenebrosa TaxID=6105 RepID=A0A6P8J287_ACTTE|nr:uncharacterized protein LOC116307550 isoform X2 [Actinia tenebrosa]
MEKFKTFLLKLATTYFIFVCYAKGVLSLSCSFDGGLCGWKNPENSTRTWLLNDGIHSSFIFTMQEENVAYLSSAKLVFPNFTGSGFLSFSYCQSGFSQLDLMIGKRKVISLESSIADDSICEWKYVTIPINSTQQQVCVEGSIPDYHSGIIALDDFIFLNNYANVCNPISGPVNSTMNCSLANNLGSVCTFQCMHGCHVIGSSRRRCLPNGKWSGIQPSCKPPQIRLKPVGKNVSHSVTSGNVQVLVNRSWGLVCREATLQIEMANVVCRSLGLGSQSNVVDFQDGKLENAWIVIKKCNGSERHILDCERSNIGRFSCPRKHVLHVICGHAFCPPNCKCSFASLAYEVKCGPPVTIDTLKNLPYYTTRLMFNNIDMSNISQHSFYKLEFLKYINLNNVSIDEIDKSVFMRQTGLEELFIDKNNMPRILEEVFPKKILFLLRQDRISFIEQNAFESLEQLYELDLRYNNLKSLSFKLPLTDELNYLYVGHNLLWNDTYELLKGQTMLYVLDITSNHLTNLRAEIFEDVPYLILLFATKASIRQIEDMTFKNKFLLRLLFLDGNQLRQISSMTFHGADDLEYLSLTNNPLNVIAHDSFANLMYLRAIYLIKTNLHTIDIGSTFVAPTLTVVHSSQEILTGIEITALGAELLRSSGYSCKTVLSFQTICFPCDQGYYKMNAFDEDKCQMCPAGGFYQDAIAHVGEIVYGLGCKQCPAGSYVKPESAPGKTKESCSACLEGTNLKKLAGFRACPCLDNFYRLDRFGKCIECPLGYQCTNETVCLLPGFYWIWKNESSKEKYQNFTELLKEENMYDYDPNWRKFDENLPIPYMCPFIVSCKGGVDSMCSDGYKGPLCAICSKGYYRMFSGCNKCPTLYLLVGQCCAVAVVAGILVFAIIKDKKSNRANRRSVSDTVFSSFKIVIGFYQVTSGTLNAYSYIKWPAALTKLMKFADLVQLNIFKLVPLECLKQSIRLTPYAGLVVYISLDAMVILIAILYFFIQKAFTNINRDNKRLSKCKANCYRAVFLVIFITYPATCEKVFQVLPSSCHKVCDNEQGCSWYLQSDYSSKCFTSFYNKFVILAYFAILIPIGFPVATTFFLWKYCRNNGPEESDIEDEGSDKVHLAVMKKRCQDDAAGHEISAGMRFLYENYSEDCWYWEVIELVRKVIFTSVLVYSGQEGRLFLGVTAILSGFYAVYFAHTQPIPHLFDKWLHLGALMATMANQFMAMLLKIPAETVSTLVDVESDAIGITVMLMFANLFVVIIIVVPSQIPAPSRKVAVPLYRSETNVEFAMIYDMRKALRKVMTAPMRRLSMRKVGMTKTTTFQPAQERFLLGQ